MNKSIIFGAVIALFPSFGFSQIGPDKAQVKIQDFSYNGRGCPSGSTKSIVTSSEAGSKDADYFQIVYDEFVAKSGPEVKRRQNKKMCEATFDVVFPKGWRFRIKNVEFNGHANLESRGLFAEVETIAEIILGESRQSVSRFFRGPYDRNFDFIEEFAEGLDTGCSGVAPIKIKTNLRIMGDTKNKVGEVSMDQVSGTLTQAFRVFWEKCEE